MPTAQKFPRIRVTEDTICAVTSSLLARIQDNSFLPLVVYLFRIQVSFPFHKEQQSPEKTVSNHKYTMCQVLIMQSRNLLKFKEKIY